MHDALERDDTETSAVPLTQLGYTYTDQITGFRGIATGKVTYLTGCAQTLLSPRCREDGSKPDPEWFDDQRLAHVSVDRILLNNGATPGFDRAAPKR